MEPINLIMGAITGYVYHDIEPWLVSLKQTDYQGDIALVCFNIHKSTIDILQKQGVICICAGVDSYGNAKFPKQEPWNICVERFSVYSKFLKENPDYTHVLLTDVKDVIFQTNPMEPFWENIRYSLEHIQYKNEDWGARNLSLSLGQSIYKNLADEIIINAGVISGDARYIEVLCEQIYLICRSISPYISGGGGPDQAVLNYLLRSLPWKTISCSSAISWACQAGTIKDPTKIEKYRPHLFVKEPFMKEDKIFSYLGNEYAIVHQWDRVPEWKEMVERKYRVSF